MLRNKKVVITGGAGFIGSNLAHILAEEKNNNEIVIIDDLSSGSLENIYDLIDTNRKKVTFFEGSITNLDFLQRTLKNVEYVFHLAAIASVTKSIEDPITTNNVNVNGTLNVLVASRDNNVKKVVFSSSCAVYGDPPEEMLPIKENTPLNPLSPYAASKLIGEFYCKTFSNVYNIPTACLRYFNVYGPHQNPSSEYSAVIPRFISRVLDDKSPVIYGDGSQTRDFISVGDVVNANILAAENKINGVFNVGSGKSFSVAELAKLITEINKLDAELQFEDPRPGDIMYSIADISKLKKELPYEPKITLSEGLEKTVKWFQNSN